MEKNSLITDRIGSVVFRFAMTFLVANILQALYGAVDMFVVGHYADSAALSAVSALCGEEAGARARRLIRYLKEEGCAGAAH